MLKKLRGFHPQQPTRSHLSLVCAALESRFMLSGSADDLNDQISEAEVANIGDSILAEIASSQDVNMYQIEVTMGQTVELDIDSDGFLDDLDSILQIFDADGNGLYYNDDGDSGDEVTGYESFLLFTPEETGTYYVGVSGFGNFYDAVEGDDDSFGGKKFFQGGGFADTGQYILNINLIDDATDIDDQITEATALDAAAGDSVLGASIGQSDVDMYRVWLDQGQEISVDIDSDSFGDNLDSVVQIFGEGGFLLASNDNGLSGDEVTGLESYLEFRAFDDGFYFIAVSGQGNTAFDAHYGDGDVVGDEGSYDLNIETLNLMSVVQLSVGGSIGVTTGFGDDLIEVRSTADGVRVLFDGVDQGSFTLDPFAEILISSLGGNDEILFQTTVVYDAIVSSGQGNDTIRVGAGNDLVFGGDGVDVIFGREGDDDLYGGDGDDRIFGQAGEDYLEGENDDDRLVGGTDRDGLIGGYGVDTMLGNAGDDYLYGDWQNDIITGGSGDDAIIGGTGNDTLIGTGGVDYIDGNSGNDMIDGNGGADDLYGGLGNDVIFGGGGGDFISGSLGDDEIDGGVGSDTIFGNAGNDLLIGGNDTDFIFGGTGMDTIEGNGGIDEINGNDGDDNIKGGTGNDIISGGIGNDIIDGEGGDDDISGDDGDDILTGGFGVDILDGGDGTDTSVDVGETEISIEI